MSAQKGTFRLLVCALTTCVLTLALAPALAQAQETTVVAQEPLALEEVAATGPEDEAKGLVLEEREPPSEQGTSEQEVVPEQEGPNELVVEELDKGEPLEVEESADEAIAVVGDEAGDVVPEVAGLSAQDEAAERPVRVAYRSHMADGSWSGYSYDGAESGFIGASSCVDAMKIKLVPGDQPVAGGISYRMHAAKKGWLDWVENGARGGAGKGLRIEALQIKLTGDMAKQYHVFYSVCLQGRGWMSWAKNGTVTGSVGLGLRIEGIKIVLVRRGNKAPSSRHVDFKGVLISGNPVSVQPNVQGQGWLPAVGNNAVAGTTGQKLRLRGLKVTLPSAEVPGGVLVKGHIQGTGWTEYQQAKVLASSNKRLEAIAMKLSGEAAKKYDIYYRAHVSRLGWMAWAKNGKAAGTKGLSVAMEAVEVYVAKKGEAAPIDDGSVEVAYYTGTNVRYRAYCQTYGWRKEVKGGGIAGTVGKSKRMEAMSMRLAGGTLPGDIYYEGYVAGSGWQGTRANSETAGTMGQSRALQAVKVSLGGRAASFYDVWYRVHLGYVGWLGWAKNGETAGAPRLDREVQAIEVRLLPKGSAAPGSTDNHYIDVTGYDAQMLTRAQGYSSPTQWLILVDLDNTRLAVFKGYRNNWRFYDSWLVSCGAPSSPTVRGVFSVGDRGYVFGHGYSCYYYTQFYGEYLFHSVKYNEGTFDVQDGRLGAHISLGCVRMNIGKAKWIYDTIPSGTTVVTY